MCNLRADVDFTVEVRRETEACDQSEICTGKGEAEKPKECRVVV